MLKIGIIGIQGYGMTSLKSLADRTDVTVTALCDLDEETTRRSAREYGVPGVFTDYREMLKGERIDAVIVATPHFLHHPMTMAALVAGKHVFCEKPLAMTVEEAEEMADSAEKAGLVLTCHYNQRTTPKVRAMRALVARGEIGDVYHANIRWMARWTGFMFHSASKWRTEQSKAGGGILIGRGSHLVDAIAYILGEPPIESVYAVTQNRLTGFEVEDYAAATLRFQSGVTVNVECSYALPSPTFREKMEFELFGTKGGIVYSKTENSEPSWQYGTIDLGSGAWQDRTTPQETIVADAPDSILNNFLEAILYGKRLIVTGRSAAYVTRILSAGYESARSATTIFI